MFTNMLGRSSISSPKWSEILRVDGEIKKMVKAIN